MTRGGLLKILSRNFLTMDEGAVSTVGSIKEGSAVAASAVSGARQCNKGRRYGLLEGRDGLCYAAFRRMWCEL